ncbi:MAG TPA: hypothetical protein VF308_06440, partial [Caldimonas sp.]
MALVGVWLGWRAWRARGAPPVIEEKVVGAGAREEAAAAPALPEALAPAAPPAPPAVAPAVPAAREPVDEVLALERADRSLWDAAIVLECAPEPLATLTDLLAASVPRARPPEGGAEAIFAVHFERDDALPVARANPSRLKDLAARRHATAVANGGGGPDAAPLGWLGGPASAMLAGTVLGAWTRTRHL